MLGLAMKAGKVVSGEFATDKRVKSGKAWLMIVSEDASDNTKKMFRDKSSFYEVPYYEIGSKEELGHAMGKEMRASLALTDPGFSNSICKLLDETQN